MTRWPKDSSTIWENFVKMHLITLLTKFAVYQQFLCGSSTINVLSVTGECWNILCLEQELCTHSRCAFPSNDCWSNRTNCKIPKNENVLSFDIPLKFTLYISQLGFYHLSMSNIIHTNDKLSSTMSTVLSFEITTILIRKIV